MSQVQNIDTPPHPAVGMLAMKWSTGGWAYGSGALIDSQHILTCSHNLVDRIQAEDPGFAKQVFFYPGYNTLLQRREPPPKDGLAVVVGFYSYAYKTGEQAWDVGLCRLGVPHNLNLPIFFNPTPTGAEIVWPVVNLSGYPGDHLGEMWEDPDEASGVDVNTNTLIYTHDTFKGSSGSPVWKLPILRLLNSTPFMYLLPRTD
jgi:V8-like Glu-specific endopeptidase